MDDVMAIFVAPEADIPSQALPAQAKEIPPQTYEYKMFATVEDAEDYFRKNDNNVSAGIHFDELPEPPGGFVKYTLRQGNNKVPATDQLIWSGGRY